MALQTSGPISLNDIHVEAGGSSGTSASINDTDIRGLTPASGKTINDSSGTQIDFFNFYGATAETSLPTGGSTINGQVQLKQISASTYISSGGTLRVPSNMWVWTDSTSTAALTIDIPCTVINDGKITSSPGPISKAISAICRAPVQLDVAIQYFLFIFAENFFSNFFR